MTYEFEHADMRFPAGSFAESVVLDRYAVSSTDPNDLKVGDTVVFIADEAKGTRKVGEIIALAPDNFAADIVARDGERYENVPAEHIVKPLETTPAEMWARWAYGAAMVEDEYAKGYPVDMVEHNREWWNDQFRWLFDGYRYSPGGRIQLGLGHEYLGRPKAQLTLVNCFVGPAVDGSGDPIEQWRLVLKSLRNQIEIQRRGGGYGINITNIKTIPGAANVRVSAVLSATHKDYGEIAGLSKLGKLEGFDSIYDTNPLHDDATYISVDDSIDGIVEALNEMVRLVYAGKRVIVDFSRLRPRHAPVSNIGRSSGAASWMTLFALAARLLRQETIDAVDFAELFAFTTNLVEQGGSRRGALMLTYHVDGPVVEKFITRKREPGRLVGANVSVLVSDEFMERVKMYEQYGDVDELYGPHEGYSATASREAHRLWTLIVESAHASAEPGVLFIDRINNESNSWYYAPLISTNPCGEQPLPANGACNLGHLVLPRFVKGEWWNVYFGNNNEVIGIDSYLDWDELERAVRLAVRFQDDMIDYSYYPTPETKKQQQLERRVGIGTMGLGTMLIMLGLRYGSDEALEFIDELYSSIAYWAYDESINIAAEKGPFPAFDYEKYVQSGFMKRLLERFPDLDEKLRRHGIRNVTLLTQAPTGTTGTYINGVLGANGFPGVSTGIEPYYAFGYERTSRIGTAWIEEPIVTQYREANGLGPDDPLPDYFVTAQEHVTAEEHVRTQAAIQRWVDSSISKTINFPASATVQDVNKAYMLGYDLGLKGVTVYVDGSRQAQVLSTKKGGAKLESHIEAEALEELEDAKMIEERSKTPLSEWISHEEFKKCVNDLFGIDVSDGVATIAHIRRDGDTVVVDHIKQTSTTLPDGEYVADAPSFRKRPNRVYGFTERLNVTVGDVTSKVYVTINVDETGAPFEVFVNANDPAIADVAEALGRLVTQFLRYGATEDNVAQAIKHLKRGQSNLFSLPSQIARLLEEVHYKGVEFPGQNVVDEGFRGLTETERESRRQFEKKMTKKIGTVYPTQARKLAPCPRCGEHSYDKAACVCYSCGESRCS